MSIPLPDLDTRRWPDLVEQGLATIVRRAPAWTDHNLHDPGVTLLELMAWAVEAGVFRANRVPESHLRKFLALAGVTQRPPQPAGVVFEVSTPAGSFRLPAGVVLRSEVRGPGPAGPLGRVLRSVPYVTTAATDIVEAALVSVHAGAAGAVEDRTALIAEGLEVRAFGEDPSAQEAPALYLGFDRTLPVGATTSLWLHVVGGDGDEPERYQAELVGAREACRWPTRRCPDADPEEAPGGTQPSGVDAVPRHHSVRLAWEVHAGGSWRTLSPEAGEVADETRALSWSGFVRVRPPLAMTPLALPEDDAPRFYLRARLVAGVCDAPPILRAVSMNAVQATQSIAVWQEHALAPGYTGGATLALGADARLRLRFDASGTITHVEDGGPDDPSALFFGYAPATATEPERVRLTLVRLGRGSGRPEQSFDLLPDALVAGVVRTTDCPPGCPPLRVTRPSVRLWTTGTSGLRPLSPRPDLDASGPRDPHAALDPVRGLLTLGDGRRGMAPGTEDHVVGTFDATLAEAGVVGADAPWRLGDDPVNGVLLGTAGPTAGAASFRNRQPSSGGAAAEPLGAAAARAAASLWAHERLVALAQGAGVDTLDRLDRDRVLALSPPERAATGLDFERLALSIPGTRVARARAWLGVDPRLGCARFPGTVTLVVLPWLPVGRPTPSDGLLATLRTFLERRRVLGTRLLVVGPEYVEVSVEAVVRARPSAGTRRLRAALEERLRIYLDPLRGGSDGRGWPFGQDVFAGDVLRVLDRVDGVDHVASLRLRVGGDPVECSNVCVPTVGLVASGAHTIRVVEP